MTPRNLEAPSKYKLFAPVTKTNTHFPNHHVISHQKGTAYYSFSGLAGGGGGNNFLGHEIFSYLQVFNDFFFVVGQKLVQEFLQQVS